jgi:putative nucleotidyltransferase with HDIG domain
MSKQRPALREKRDLSLYKIDTESNSRRKAVEDWLFGLDLLSPAVRDRVVTAWVSSWSSSPHERLEDMPFNASTDYPLMHHVNEVTRTGVDLAKRAAADWGRKADNDILVPILILHDVDKPLLYTRDGKTLGTSALYRELPHGVIGAMLLKDLGFPQVVINTVATHATTAPFHGKNFEAYVLHYADMFAADHALMTVGREPFYQKHFR